MAATPADGICLLDRSVGAVLPLCFHERSCRSSFLEKVRLGYIEPVCINALGAERVLHLLPVMHERHGCSDDFPVLVPYMKPHAF